MAVTGSHEPDEGVFRDWRHRPRGGLPPWRRRRRMDVAPGPRSARGPDPGTGSGLAKARSKPCGPLADPPGDHRESASTVVPARTQRSVRSWVFTRRPARNPVGRCRCGTGARCRHRERRSSSATPPGLGSGPAQGCRTVGPAGLVRHDSGTPIGNPSWFADRVSS